MVHGRVGVGGLAGNRGDCYGVGLGATVAMTSAVTVQVAKHLRRFCTGWPGLAVDAAWMGRQHFR